MSIGFMNDAGLSNAKETFMFDCRAAGLAPKTLRRYHHGLTKFVTFVGDLTVQELKPDHVRSYIAYLADCLGTGRRHLAKHYAVIRTWIRWLYAQMLLTDRRSAKTAPRLRDLFLERGA
jgi:site-specific recombinase XerD